MFEAPLRPAGAIRAHWLQGLLPHKPAHPALDVSTRADVCIVGAGFTGLWTALALNVSEDAGLAAGA